jgi:hypothetical protein
MNKAYLTRTPMIVHGLEKDINPFRSKEEGEEVFRAEYTYLSVIGVLIYHANNTRPDIAFTLNCLARHSAAPTMRHWNDIKNILRYLHGMIDLGLFFRRNQDSTLIKYTDVSYLSDPHNTISQTRFMFLHRGTTISWKSWK